MPQKLKPFPMSSNPAHKPEWQQLQRLAAKYSKIQTTDLFKDDPDRFEDFSVNLDGLIYDYSKQRVGNDVRAALSNLIRASDFETARKAMLDGEIINPTEKRAVLHTALRRPAGDIVKVSGENVIPAIHETLSRMKKLSDDLHARKLKGATGKPIDTIISIGIGGSDLGPRMVHKALETRYESPVNTFYVSNIDGEDIEGTLKQADPETTLFIVISKSFTTQETLTNAKTARQWLKTALPEGADIAPHYIAVSSNIPAAVEFGLAEDNIYPMWEWVNGRFSLWSAVGLPACLTYGYEVFRELLDGAYDADRHFTDAAVEENIPCLMAAMGIWNRNFLGFSCHALLPYTEKLTYMPAYVQQLEMESNGKSVDLDGNPITDYATCPVIFGEVGTNGQHSFYQLLHQGTDKVPCDFIGSIENDTSLPGHHTLLLSHMLAQGQAMLQGRTASNEPYRYFAGNIPSSTFLFDRLDARSIGFLIALYEHKTFVQGLVWNINSFDQFGVELGKEMAGKLEKQDIGTADPSTKALYSFIHKAGK
jgi:glucose-6-phosphate isomerase